MADKELTKEEIAELDNAINEYYECNTQFNSIKHNKEVYNAYIKEILKKSEILKYSTNEGINASLTITNKPIYAEEKLIEFLKPLNIPGLIKTKEFVDMEVLEDCIYHNQINAADLAPYKEDKFTETLRVTKSKPLKS
jgi:hypothetical protein